MLRHMICPWKTALMPFWLALICALIPTGILAESEEEAVELFSDGKMLVERNCAVCEGGTREGFLEGISLIEQAIEAGYADRLSADKELANTYGLFAGGYTRSGSEERKIYIRKFRELYERILELDPNDTELRMSYADTLKDKESRLAEYRKILKIDPDHFSARFLIGAALLETRDPQQMEQGMKELKTAMGLTIGVPPRRDFLSIFQGLAEDLKVFGRPDLGQELLEALNEEMKRRDAEREN